MHSHIRRRALCSSSRSASLAVLAGPSESGFSLTHLASKWTQAPCAVNGRYQRGLWTRNFFTGNNKAEQNAEKKETTPEPTPEAPQSEVPEQQKATEKEGEEQETPDQKKVKELEAQVLKLKDDYLRCLAEQQNLVRITKNDVENAKLFGIKGFATGIIEVADNLERALGTVTAEKRAQIPELESLYNGVEMTEKVLLKILEKHGVAKFAPKGEKFNPAQHEALFEVQDPSLAPGTVAIVQAAGYSLNGRLLRPAQVGVVTSPPPSSA